MHRLRDLVILGTLSGALAALGTPTAQGSSIGSINRVVPAAPLYLALRLVIIMYRVAATICCSHVNTMLTLTRPVIKFHLHISPGF